MALTIENGTGVTGAESYASEAELVAFAAARGVTIATTDAAALLVKAMDRLAGLPYKGDRVARDQALDWPRSGVCVDGFSYAATELPSQLKQAQLILALAANSTDLQPVQEANAPGPMTSDTVGPLTTTWAPGRMNTAAIVPAAEKLLAKLLQNHGAARVVRA